MIIFYFHMSVKTLHSTVSLFIFTEIAQSVPDPRGASARRMFVHEERWRAC
jgi:hypothetical protein